MITNVHVYAQSAFVYGGNTNAPGDYDYLLDRKSGLWRRAQSERIDGRWDEVWQPIDTSEVPNEVLLALKLELSHC